MASPRKASEALTLEQILETPRIVEHPDEEFIIGRIEVRVSPKLEPAAIEGPLGWPNDPYRGVVEGYREGRPVRQPDDGPLEGEPMLAGVRVPVAEAFDRFVHRRPRGAG